MQARTLIMTALFIGALVARPALAADWQMKMTMTVPYVGAEGDVATQAFTAGARSTALDGFDNQWDTVALGSSILTVYAYHPDFAVENRLLIRDFRSELFPQEWDIYVGSDQDGKPVTLTWTLPPNPACLGLSLSLTDTTTGAAVDLTQASYGYTNDAATPRRFHLMATRAAVDCSQH